MYIFLYIISVCMSVCLAAWLAVCLDVWMSGCLHAYMYAYLVYQSAATRTFTKDVMPCLTILDNLRKKLPLLLWHLHPEVPTCTETCKNLQHLARC